MKKVLALILATAMLLSLAGICSFAEDTVVTFGSVEGETVGASQYHNNGTVAARFVANGKFHKLQFASATWGNATGSYMTIDLYAFDTDYATSVAGTKIASVGPVEMADNASNGGDFGKDIDAGEYIAVLTFTGNECGLYEWTYTGTNDKLAFYRNGDIVPGKTMHADIFYSDGTDSVGTITNSGETPAVTVPLYEGDGFGVAYWLNIADENLNCTGNVWVLFNTDVKFKGVKFRVLYASNAAQVASVDQTAVSAVVDVLAWQGSVEATLASTPVASATYNQVGDTENIDILFGKTIPAGQYIIRFAETSKQDPMPDAGGIGVYFNVGGNSSSAPIANVEFNVENASNPNNALCPSMSIIFSGEAETYFKAIDKTLPGPETEAPQTGDMTVTVFAVVAVMALAAVVVFKKKVNA